MDLISVVEYATIVVTLIMIASGAPTCINMYNKRSTRNVPYMLFLVSMFLSAICLQYGMVIKNQVIILINIISLLVWGLYSCVYVLVSKSKTLPMMKMMLTFLLFWVHNLYLNTLPEKDVATTLGLFSVFWCTVCYVMPATDIHTMVKEKSAASCDLSLLVGGTLSAAVWYLYGVLVDDFNIYFPSIPAIIISVIKFFLMMFYGSGPKPKVVKKSTTRTTTTNHNVSTDFHKEVYDVNSRDGLRQRN